MMLDSRGMIPQVVEDCSLHGHYSALAAGFRIASVAIAGETKGTDTQRKIDKSTNFASPAGNAPRRARLNVNDPISGQPADSWQHSIYEQLHRLAEAALARERPGHSLQPTLLVNDAYLRLLEQRNVDPHDRSQMIAVGATIIRRLLVDYARTRRAKKRGGAAGRGIPLRVSVADSANQLEILELNDAMEALERESPRAVRVVELKFFGGLTVEEIADHLSISSRTVTSDWQFAKAWLYRKLETDHPGSP